MADLVNPITEDGDYDIKAVGTLNDYRISGDFGGGTVQVQVQNPADEVWINVTGASYTENGTDILEVNNESTIRFNVSGSTTPSIYIAIMKASKTDG